MGESNRAVRLIRDGVIKLDSGTMFGSIPKMTWNSMVSADRENRIVLGLNCLLVQTCGKNILIDTCVGSKELDEEKRPMASDEADFLQNSRQSVFHPRK